MKKIHQWLAYFVVIITCFAVPVTVKADIGPKPSVVIEVVGFEEKEYYMTLLSEKDSTGPWSHGNEYHDYMGEKWVFEVFENYEDEDGYYFLSFMQDCSENDTFEWTYYPPQRFKVLIYTTDDGQFYCSDEVYERYAFDSYFKVNVTENGVTVNESGEVENENVLTVQKSYDFSMEILSFAVRVFLTIVLEVLVALAFGYRDSMSLKVIGITNVCTQVVLNVLLNVINYRSGQMAFVFHYVWMECVVFVLEAVIYVKLIEKTDGEKGVVRHPVVYAALANIVSLTAGIWIAKMIPGIF